MYIVNTTNSLDGGVFAQLKKFIKLHQGMSRRIKVKLIDDIFLIIIKNHNSGTHFFIVDYDERETGVMKMIEMAVEGAKRNKRHSGICGQGPSDYPEMAEALVTMGIESISLNPDTMLQTIQNISELEAQHKEII